MKSDDEKPKLENESVDVTKSEDQLQQSGPKKSDEPDSKDEPESKETESEKDLGPQPTPPPAPADSKPKRSFGQKLKSMLRSKKFWLSLVGLLVVAVIAAWFIQPSRWWVMNLFGGSNTVTVTTITPGEGKTKAAALRNVAVTVNGKSYKTDDKGTVKISGVPFGKSTITAKKAGYQDTSYGVTLDFDPFLHLFGGKAQDDAARNVELSMKATGMPVSFKVVDWLSGQPVTVGDFTVSDVVAKPDAQGLVSLKIPGTDDSKATVSASFGGKYIDKQFEVTIGANAPETVSVVPGGKHYFVSKRSGVLTVYSSNLDGTDVQAIVTGTGQETDATAFAVSPDGKYGALSSTRDGERNAKRDLVQRLYVVDLATKELTRVDEAVRIYFADWSQDTLVYTTYDYDSTGNNYQTTLRSVDASNKRVNNFESADNVSVFTVAFDKVVYTKYISTGDDHALSPILRSANVNGTAIKTLGNQLVYSSYTQLDFDRIVFKTEQDQVWHEYNLNTDNLKTISQPSSGSNTQQYLSTANSDGSKRLMVDRIDGKYSLIVKDTSTGESKTLYSAGGLGGPIRWMGDVIVYRVVTPQETADYAVSINGGEPKKITDVTATASTQDAVVDQRFRFY